MKTRMRSRRRKNSRALALRKKEPPMNKVRRTILPMALALLAAGSLLAAVKLPLWHLRMEAPQYKDQEALRVNVFAGSMSGDLREITVLNQYIGVHIPPVLPQASWLPQALLASGA